MEGNRDVQDQKKCTANASSSSDWRTQIPPDAREKIVEKIFEVLKKYYTFSYPQGEATSELKSIALRFEDKCYTTSPNQTDYLRRISAKMISVEAIAKRNMRGMSGIGAGNPNASSSASNIIKAENEDQAQSLGSSHSIISNVGPSSNLQNTSQNLINTTSGQGAIPNMYATATRQMQERHMQQQAQQQNQSQNSVIYQHQLQQLMNPKISHPMHVQMQQQRQPAESSQQNMMQMTSSFQSNQPSSVQGYLPSLVNQQQSVGRQQLQLMGSQSNISNTQQSQFFGQQIVNPQTFSMHHHQQYQNQVLGSQMNQPSVTLLQQTNSGTHQQQTAASWQPSVMMLKSQIQQPQHQSQVGSQISQWRQQQLVMQQQQSTSLQRGMQQQRDYSKASSSMVMDSTGQAPNVNISELQEEVYQKITSMKEKYFLELKEVYPKIVQRMKQLEAHNQLEHYEKFNRFKVTLETCFQFLQFPKDKIQPSLKDRLPAFEKQIVTLLSLSRSKSSVDSQQHSQRDQSTQLQQQPSNIPHKGNVQSSSVPESTPSNMKFTAPSNLGQIQESSFGLLQTNMNAVREQNSTLKPYMNHCSQFRAGISFRSSSPLTLQTAFPQISQSSSPQIDQQYMSTSLQNASSLFVVPSPSTPIVLTPVNNANTQDLVLTAGTMETSPSPLIEEFTTPEARQSGSNEELDGLNANEQPLAKLIKAVQSLSPSMLRSSVNDIASVVSVTDKLAGSTLSTDFRAEVGEDLAAVTGYKSRGRSFILQDENSAKKLKVEMTATPFSALPPSGSVDDNCNPHCGLGTSELDSTATSSVTGTGNPYLEEEIQDVNQKLINTFIQIDYNSDDSIASAGYKDIIMVKCTFSPVSFSKDLIAHIKSNPKFQMMPLRLLVPLNYPISSPEVFDKLPDELNEQTEDFSIQTQLMFTRSLRTLSHPMSLKEMVNNWDFCAREVITKYAIQFGGGTFSSVHGTWDQCFENATNAINRDVGMLL